MLFIIKIVRNTITRIHILNLETQYRMCLQEIESLHTRLGDVDLVHEREYIKRSIDVKKKVLGKIEMEIMSLKKDIL